MICCLTGLVGIDCFTSHQNQCWVLKGGKKPLSSSDQKMALLKCYSIFVTCLETSYLSFNTKNVYISDIINADPSNKMWNI